MNKASEDLLKAWQVDGVDYGHAGSKERYRGKRRKRTPKWKSLSIILVSSAFLLNNAPSPAITKPPPPPLFIAAELDIDKEVDIGRPSRKHIRTPVAPHWLAPLTSYEVTTCYVYRWGTMHYGIDMSTSWGSSIFSVGSGKVVQAGWDYDGYGYSVTVDHGDGWQTFYAHASRILVKTGQTVGAGSRIALVGSTGDSTGPHLHLGVTRYKFGQWTNPKTWLLDRGVSINGC